MKITDDVIRDLLPLYQAGEASADTRALVDGYLAEHPALAEEARRSEAWSLPEVGRRADPDSERVALRRTKALLAWKSWVLATAIFFTAAPLSFEVSDKTGFRWLMWGEHPGPAVVSLLVGVTAWVAYALLRRRLTPRGF
jgi:anti-sigma factor RsiW